jgi:hypothetical protein
MQVDWKEVGGCDQREKSQVIAREKCIKRQAFMLLSYDDQ